MDDEVKITVIATGFQRENLPQLKRRQEREEAPIQVATRAPAPVYVPPIAAAPQPQPEPAVEEPIELPLPLTDLDMPGYLRRDRRYFN